MANVEKPNKKKYHGIEVEFNGLNVSLNDTPILKDVFGNVKTGEILVVMGPTGAGKTTLMNALAGRRPLQSGEIRANGIKMTKFQRRMVGYVEQSDIFIPILTLIDTLKFTALLRLPRTMSYKSKMDRVNQLVQILELQKCKNTVIGAAHQRSGLSGGEKKRTSIAVELLTNPALLLLDEPTTGLDSNTAYNLMHNIKQYSVQYKKSIIVNIHQPSSQIFYMSDKLLLLINGEVGYFGASRNVIGYFASLGLMCTPHYNPADFVMDCARGGEETVAKLIQAARTSHTYVEDSTDDDKLNHNGLDQNRNNSFNKASDFAEKCSGLKPITDDTVEVGLDNETFQAQEGDEEDVRNGESSGIALDENFLLKNVDVFYDPTLKYQSSYWMQLYILFVRQLKMFVEETLQPWNLVAMCILLAIIVGLFWDRQPIEEQTRERIGFLYFIHVFTMFRCTVHSVIVTHKAMPVIFKERISCSYRLSALCIAACLGDLLLGCILQLLIAIIGYWTTGFRSVETFFLMVLCLLLFSASMTGISSVLSTTLNDFGSSLIASLLACMFAFLVSGYIINPLPWYMYWSKYIVPFGFSYNSVIFTLFRTDYTIQCAVNVTSVIEECNQGLITEFPSSHYLRLFDWAVPVWANVLVLIATVIFTRSLNYILMRYWRTPLKMIKK